MQYRFTRLFPGADHLGTDGSMNPCFRSFSMYSFSRFENGVESFLIFLLLEFHHTLYISILCSTPEERWPKSKPSFEKTPCYSETIKFVSAQLLGSLVTFMSSFKAVKFISQQRQRFRSVNLPSLHVLEYHQLYSKY